MFCRMLLCCLTTIAITGCTRGPGPNVKVEKAKDPDPVVHIKEDPNPDKVIQGLTKAERERFHHLSMGSEIIPLAWLRALTNVQTKTRFLDSIGRYGLIPDRDTAERLPIGLSVAPSRDLRFAGPMVGLNCAACHTNELTFVEKRVRIEGAPGLFDVESFTKDLITSLVVTSKDPRSMLAFVQRLHDDEDYVKSLRKERPVAAKMHHTFWNFEELQREGPIGNAFADRIKKLHADEQARSDQEPIEVGAWIRDDAEAAKARLKNWFGKVEHGELESILAKDMKQLGVFASFTIVKDREEALRQTLEYIVETMRLLKARADFALKGMALAKLKLENTPGGPGRVDDFGAARNLLFDIKNARAMNAPCSVPHLWGTGKLHWSNWDDSTQATLERSVATALAAGAVFDSKTHQSTVLLRNLGELEALSAKITAPAWPEDVFGKIDPAKADRGAVHFKKHCAKCHGPADVLVDVKEVGTDPQRVLNYAVPLGEQSFGDAVQIETGKYVARAAQDDKISDAELDKFRGGHKNVWRTTGKYAARPLSAVWATAPYLHNGSVPTIYDLLLPAAERPKAFRFGHREYDPAKLGFQAAINSMPSFLFDTSKAGNSNAGHEYGITLTDEQRFELIEYLKTL